MNARRNITLLIPWLKRQQEKNKEMEFIISKDQLISLIESVVELDEVEINELLVGLCSVNVNR